MCNHVVVVLTQEVNKDVMTHACLWYIIAMLLSAVG